MRFIWSKNLLFRYYDGMTVQDYTIQMYVETKLKPTTLRLFKYFINIVRTCKVFISFLLIDKRLVQMKNKQFLCRTFNMD